MSERSERPGRRVEATLPAVARSVGAAREIASDALAEFGHPALEDIVQLLVSELVTNAVLHARTTMRISIEATADGIRFEIHDSSAVLPGRGAYGPEATNGRGLRLVELLAHEWGVQPQVKGKTVWFALNEGAGTPPDLDAWDDNGARGTA